MPVDRITERYTADVRCIVAVRELRSRLIADYPYAAPSGHWAGGNVTVTVQRAASPGACAETRRVWSSNGKWSGNDLDVTLQITDRALLSGLDLMVGGLVTLDAERICPGDYRVVWAAQHGKLGLRTVGGWLIHGYHSMARTLDKARAEARAARERALAAELAVRQREADLATIWISADDSAAAGNCAAGTSAFSTLVHQRLGATAGTLGAVRADVAASIRDDIYVRRAIAVASSHRRAIA